VFQFTKQGKIFNWGITAAQLNGELLIEVSGKTPIASCEIAFGLTAYKQTGDHLLLKLAELNKEEISTEKKCRIVTVEKTRVIVKDVWAGDLHLVRISEFQTALQQINPNSVTGKNIEIEFSIEIKGGIAPETL